jgi:hypothetical protein
MDVIRRLKSNCEESNAIEEEEEEEIAVCWCPAALGRLGTRT